MSKTSAKLQFLLDLQEQLGGAISFERWMKEALYHAEFGYYSANIRGIGRRGDFTTWPVLHDSLARAIARWALENKPPGRWHLIEIGAGSGELAAGVLRAIGWWNRPRFHIVEISGPLRQEQQRRLGGKAIWHETVGEALAACDGSALIFSNELVDAFPARIFRMEGCGPSQPTWKELFLRIEGGRINEIWKETPLPDSTVFTHAWPDGQRVEVQESFRHWSREWRPAWRSGAMLIIDYGDTCPALYHRRPGGTLRAYAYHQRLEGSDAYSGFGSRDLTVDVNFSDLQNWTGKAGKLFTLGEFLGQSKGSPQLAEAANAFKIFIQPAAMQG